MAQAIADFFSQTGDVSGKLLSPRRSFTSPEGNTGRSAVGVFHQHPARFSLHAANAPRSVAEKHDVAGIALHGEVFVECAHHNSIRFGDYGEQRRLRDGAATGDGGEPASAPRAQFAIHPVAMDV